MLRRRGSVNVPGMNAPTPTPWSEARTALDAWREDTRTNYYESDPLLDRVLRRHLEPEAYAAARPGLSDFGALSAQVLDPLIRENNRDENLPRLRRFDDFGHRIDAVDFHPSYGEIGRHVYRTPVIRGYAEPGQERVQLAYAYLLAHHGEGGHLCPLACTAGLVKLLQHRGDDALKARLLPGLLHDDRLAPEHLHGAQFLTEIQGGSDVGANALRATREGSDWRLDGEKWFCSVIDADLYLVTARPEGAVPGTSGLGAFVVPRLRPDGTLNGVHVRRLKYKLGTRSMASGEADFVDCFAWALGPIDGAFKAVVEVVLNTSRVYNAVAACGVMRRAELEAAAYARHRTAFGRPIDQFVDVRRTLDGLRARRSLAVAGTFALIALQDRIALGAATAGERDVFRLVVNMNKYATACASTDQVRAAIEVLGGNGAIEEFSVLPRLLRDSIVVEAWEGTHNVLCAQVLRDLHKFGLHRPFFAGLRTASAALSSAPTSDEIEALSKETEALLVSDPDTQTLGMRALVDRLVDLWQRVALAEVEGAR